MIVTVERFAILGRYRNLLVRVERRLQRRSAVLTNSSTQETRHLFVQAMLLHNAVSDRYSEVLHGEVLHEF